MPPAAPLVPPLLPCVFCPGRTVFQPTLVSGSCSTNFHAMGMALALPMASLASTIAVALSKSKIKTVDESARAVESAHGFVAIQ